MGVTRPAPTAASHGRYKVNYECTGCGAPAEVTPRTSARGGIVMVPHGPLCPVAISVAQARARRGMQCPAGGVHNWVQDGDGMRCTKCGARG